MRLNKINLLYVSGKCDQLIVATDADIKNYKLYIMNRMEPQCTFNATFVSVWDVITTPQSAWIVICITNELD